MALKVGAVLGGVGGRRVFDREGCVSLVRELRQSFISGRTKSYEWRAHQLKMVIKFLQEKEPAILEALHQDLCKPSFETYIAEISLLKSSCEFLLKHLKKWMKPEKASVSFVAQPARAEIVPEPLGIILVISAWNYPLLLSLNPVVGAIAAGNAVVLKPSEISPATSSLLASLVLEYLDTSAIKVVEGAVDETTALLEQKWDKIFYTGSGKVGRIVMTAAAKHLTPVTLELGGKCPVVVDSNTDLKITTKRIAGGKWGSNNGQACIAPDYVITTRSFAPKLVESFKRTLASFYGNDPLESNDLSRIVGLNHFTRLLKLLDEEKASSKIVHGGERDEKRLRIAPTILLDVPADSLVMNEEIFGPLLPIVTVEKIEDSFDVINSQPKPLAAYLFTKDKRIEKMFVEQISAGAIVVNDTVLHLANPSLPFGGVGDSGIGAYNGKYSFEAFSHMKPVLYRGFVGELSARYPPYSSQKLKLLRSLLTGDIVGLILSLIGWHSKTE
ncbi:aldehyde dehydrogenase family 3 member H1-like [Nymphaea colorata]|nr:aldehyde dehydrogenase family 3 member H1-like [Nymphaea colorata]